MICGCGISILPTCLWEGLDVWKKQLKHPLCYNIITGSDADFELFVLLFVLLTFVYY